jgi:outer membrane protein assembly factor BamE
VRAANIRSRDSANATGYRHLRHSVPLLVPLAVLLAMLGGCGWFDVHRIPVQQGNVVTQDMIDQLRPGMTRRQVAFVLGEPVLRNAFEPDRWDYVYRIYDRERHLEVRRVSLFFRDDRLSHFAGDVAPGDVMHIPDPEPPELEFLPRDEDFPPPGTGPAPEPLPEPGPAPMPAPGPYPGPGTP